MDEIVAFLKDLGIDKPFCNRFFSNEEDLDYIKRSVNTNEELKTSLENAKRFAVKVKQFSDNELYVECLERQLARIEVGLYMVYGKEENGSLCIDEYQEIRSSLGCEV